MSAHVSTGDLVPVVVLILLSGFLVTYFAIRRRTTGINALDWFIAIFGTTFVMAIFQILKLYFQDSWALFRFAEDTHSLLTNPVRVFHLIALLILFVMAEYFLNDRLDPLHFGILMTLLGAYVFLSVIYPITGILIKTNELIAFAQPTTIDGLLFDLIQIEVVLLLQYVYFKQYQVTQTQSIKKYLVFLNMVLFTYFIGSVIEILEHFVPIGDINAFLTTLPMFLLLAAFYIRYPNFIYLAPSKVKFLQLISDTGELLYAVEISEATRSKEFLIAPIFASVNSLIGELVGNEQITMKTYIYDNGVILLEKIGNVQAILQAERSAKVLRRSMRYFLREFIKSFEDQIHKFSGAIVPSNGIHPDDILRKCIPIVQSVPLISSITGSATGTTN